MDPYRQASDLAGRHSPKLDSKNNLHAGNLPADSAQPVDQAGPSGVPQSSSGFLGMMGGVGAAAHKGSPHKAAEMLSMQQSPTAEKMARGIIAIGDMMATSISKTSVALGGALNNYANAAMNRSPALSEPLTLSKSYVSRLSMIQMFTNPAARGAQVLAQYAGDLAYYFFQMMWMVYKQLAAMKVVPQIAAGGVTDEAGVPLNPVRSGLPMGPDELAAFKLVLAALLMAYVEVYDATEEAAQILFKQAAAAGERYLAHRHGGEAADVASAAVAIITDLLNLTINWLRLLGRGLVSKAATSTARSYLLENVPDLKLD